MKKLGSHAIALAGVGSAISLAAVAAAVFQPIATIALLVVAALGVMLPMTYGFWQASLVSYIAVSGLSIAMAGPIEPLAFILMFGPYSIILYLLDFKFYRVEKLNKWVKIAIIAVIKLGFFQLAMFAVYKLMGIVLSDIALFNIDWKYWIVALLGTVAFSLYDVLLRWVFKNMIYLVTRIIKKPPRR